MKKILFPKKKEWQSLTLRPTNDFISLSNLVDEIFMEVRTNGDDALKRYTLKYDNVDIKELKVDVKSIEQAGTFISDELKLAIQLAKNNIEKFHRSQEETPLIIETTPGVKCWRESRGIENVGIYIPGGSAPLFSTVLMLGIPAKLAGCKEIILCTPPDVNGLIAPAVLYAASLVGITSIYNLGGIQAIAAMCYGTETIPKVDKIFGPGNQYVTSAKQKAQSLGVAIDIPAGPSELLVIADDSCVPAFVAADLLSQAEHGPDSQVMLLSDNKNTMEQIIVEINNQIELLPRKAIAKSALDNSKAILLDTIAECIDYSNAYAPEHLILAIENAQHFIKSITNAGSVFIGNYSCESAGDYASGTNHTLPTNGYARSYSGVSLDSFIKKITFQEITKKGMENIGPSIELMAEAEQLFAHKNAVSIRLNNL